MATSDTATPGTGDGAGTDTGTDDGTGDDASTTTTDATTTTDDAKTKQPSAADELANQLAAAKNEAAAAKAEAERNLKEARKHEARAKANSDAAKQLEDIRTKDLPDHERALAEARKEGRAVALTEFGVRLARAEFRAAAAGRVEDAKLDAIIDGLNLARFVDEDGEAKRDDIKAYVDTIVPAAPALPEPPKEPEQDPAAMAAAATRPSGSQPGATGDIGQGAGRGNTPLALNDDGLVHAIERAVGIRQ